MSDVADRAWIEAYRRGQAAAKASARIAGAAEAGALLVAARRDQPSLSNEDLKQFWAPAEWGALYEPPAKRRRS
jgi:hypothetical protein